MKSGVSYVWYGVKYGGSLVWNNLGHISQQAVVWSEGIISAKDAVNIWYIPNFKSVEILTNSLVAFTSTVTYWHRNEMGKVTYNIGKSLSFVM